MEEPFYGPKLRFFFAQICETSYVFLYNKPVWFFCPVHTNRIPHYFNILIGSVCFWINASFIIFPVHFHAKWKFTLSHSSVCRSILLLFSHLFKACQVVSSFPTTDFLNFPPIIIHNILSFCDIVINYISLNFLQVAMFYRCYICLCLAKLFICSRQYTR